MEAAVTAQGHGEGLGGGGAGGDKTEDRGHLKRCLLGKEAEKHADSLPAGVLASVQLSWTAFV